MAELASEGETEKKVAVFGNLRAFDAGLRAGGC